MVTRHGLLSLLAILSAAGCQTSGFGKLPRPNPAVPKVSLRADEVIREHNRNAEKVLSFEAKPAITVTTNQRSGGVSGKLAMDRPRNFKLVLSTSLHTVADIGSNNSEFWFWVKDSEEKAVFVCNYDETGSSPLAATLQPDWIVEALGLRIIPEEEAAEITVKPGKEGTLVLTHQPSQAHGEPFTRVTIISESTHRIREHRIYDGDQKKLLAQAVVSSYQAVKYVNEPGGAEESVFLPLNVKLEWIQEKLTLDVTLKEPKVNTKFNESRRAVLFTEPAVKGYARVNLADRAGIASAPMTIRQTRPAPPSRVQLGEPTPVGVDDSARRNHDPIALSADLPPLPTLTDQVVGPRIPRAPDPDSLKSVSSGWRSAAPLNLER